MSFYYVTDRKHVKRVGYIIIFLCIHNMNLTNLRYGGMHAKFNRIVFLIVICVHFIIIHRLNMTIMCFKRQTFKNHEHTVKIWYRTFQNYFRHFTCTCIQNKRLCTIKIHWHETTQLIFFGCCIFHCELSAGRQMSEHCNKNIYVDKSKQYWHYYFIDHHYIGMPIHNGIE
jgi:hypothetical protein